MMSLSWLDAADRARARNYLTPLDQHVRVRAGNSLTPLVFARLMCLPPLAHVSRVAIGTVPLTCPRMRNSAPGARFHANSLCVEMVRIERTAARLRGAPGTLPVIPGCGTLSD